MGALECDDQTQLYQSQAKAGVCQEALCLGIIGIQCIQTNVVLLPLKHALEL